MPSALDIHRAAAPLDLHVDFVIQGRLFGYDPRKQHRAGAPAQPLFWHCDVPRMREAGYAGAVLGVHYFPWQSEAGWRECLRQLDAIDALETDPRVQIVRSHADWDAAKLVGKLALGAGVEGAHMLNGNIERVDILAQRGVRYLTLTHFSKNAAATPSMGRGANEHDGLTHFGEDLVRALNRAGIAVDVAHVNGPGVLDACAVSEAPVFCTHTGAKGVHNSPRNIGDAQIDAIAGTGGAIGIIFGPMFLRGSIRGTFHDVADHIDYVVQRVGVDHVAFGSDFDGWLMSIPSDCRDCRDTVRLTDILLARGYSSNDIYKMYRGNALRVFRDVDQVARSR